MNSALLCCSMVAALALASCGQTDPNKVPDASGVTPEQRAKASAAFRSGHFEKSKPGKYEWTTPPGTDSSEKK